MAKDDYHVIVYKILAYLYTMLKEGKNAEPEMLRYDGELFQINEIYWAYIIENLIKEGYVEGIVLSKPWQEGMVIKNLDHARITPKGIEYVTDNHFMKKAMDFLRDIKSITPFV